MLVVAGEPFVGHQLRLLAEQGFRDVVICSGHLEEQLRDYAGDGRKWGCRLRYSSDGKPRLGTGGALLKALPLLGESFLVMYGDSYLPTDLNAVWRAFVAGGKQGLMTVYRNEGRYDRSNVCFENGVIRAYSKEQPCDVMHHIDYGLSCFESAALEAWSAGACFDLSTVVLSLLEQGQLAGLEVNDRFYEIGSAVGFAETDELLRRRATLRHERYA